MGRIVFFLEEPSMRRFLEKFLQTKYPNTQFLYITHEGKNDLLKSIPRKLRAWNKQGDQFFILIDQDNNDCVELKHNLTQLCAKTGRPETLVRIVCRELEAWYLGDLQAVARAYDKPGIARLSAKGKYSTPDSIRKPSEELLKIVNSFQKGDGAEKIAPYIDPDRNRSPSFRAFVTGLEKVIQRL